ncbi:MAG: hypothetical protein EB149_07770 [Thaumarchaeota archaeon]|nr:hypothetical protein [Nitrososphaerota archaeon]
MNIISKFKHCCIIVSNYRVFDEAMQLKSLFDYLAIPLHFAFVVNIVKTGLLKKKLDVDDKIRNNFRLAMVTGALFLFAYLSHIIEQNFLH